MGRSLFVGAALVLAGCDFNPCVDGGDIEQDTDGDTIPDCVETSGVDINDDDQVDAVTHTNPLRKDIFVKIDWMECGSDTADSCADGHGHQPIADSLADVTAALAAAPVNNPDGSTGIDLQVEMGEAVSHQEVCDCACLADLVDNQRRVLSAEERGRSNAGDLLEAKRKLVHYFLWGHAHEDTGSSGVACPNGYTEVSLGRWDFNGTRAEQAGTFMHELGHQLGLGHGGGDEVNNKPNYLSIMNYSFQTDFAGRLAAMDYSRSELSPLNEDNLDEAAGIGANDATLTSFFTRTRDLIDVNSQGDIDWNQDGDKTDVVTSGLDINGDGICITTGGDGTLESRKAGDDRYFAKNRSGWLVPADNTRAAANDDDKFVDLATGETRISTGPDTILDTSVEDGDTLVQLAILNGADRICDTTKSDSDDEAAANGAAENRTLSGYDDWGHIHLNALFLLKGGLGATPPSPLNSPSQPELTFKRSLEQQVSDVFVLVEPSFSARSRTLEYQVVVGNGGPKPTTGPAHIDLFLPATAASVTCSAPPGDACTLNATGTKLLIDTTPLAPGASRTFKVSLQVDASACATPAAYTARVRSSILNIEADTSNDKFSIAFPDADGDGTLDVCGWPITELGVYGLSAVRVGDRAQVLESHGPYASAIVAKRNAENGLGAFRIGVSAHTGDALTGGNLMVEKLGVVDGNAVAAGSLVLRKDARVLGTAQPGQVPTPALPALELAVDFSAPVQGSIALISGQSVTLAPGRYGQALAATGSDLTLVAGDYVLDSLTLQAGSRIHLDTSAGPIRLFVRTSVMLDGTWEASESGLVLLAFAGTSDVTVNTVLSASILAPLARVMIGTGTAQLFTGAVLAREVNLHPDLILRHDAFRGSWPWLP